MKEKIRIAKLIASSRKYSRRRAEELIELGKVKVNGELINTPVFFASAEDTVEVEGKKLYLSKSAGELDLYMFNKPRGCLTTKYDPKGRPTVYDYLPRFAKNLLYVGRLDYNSEGLLLFTSNGELANQLVLGKNQIPKTYRVKTFGHITQETINNLGSTIVVDNVTYRNVKIRLISQKPPQSWLEFRLTEGKNNEIRNICEHLGLQVRKLIRVQFAHFKLGDTPSADLVEIPISEIKKLPFFSTLKPA